MECFVHEAGWDRIGLVKIDAEGHDLAVLRGGERLFAWKRVSIVQFEYSIRWVDARCFLRDAFELLQPLGYLIGKLTSKGVEFYPAWEPAGETFIEGNYVACVADIAVDLPSVRWWNCSERRRRDVC